MKHSILLSLALLAACHTPPPDPAPSGLRITGPYAHENLAVYLIHKTDADPQEFLTLDEGLKSGRVEVSEKQQEQVNQLLVENRGDLPLFIQEGDRLQGGKQDRIVGISLVVPPKSGKVAVPAFCVEQGRWARGADGANFKSTSNRAFASNTVRYAGKVQMSQGGVWQEVEKQKKDLQQLSGAPNTNSSLNESIDSKQVMDLASGCEKALADVAARHGDAVGVAFAVNGKIQEVVTYPGPALLRKVYGRLLSSYAIQAAAARKAPASAAPAVDQVSLFMTESARKKKDETRQIDRDNGFRLAEFDKKAYCESSFRGKTVCAQWFAEPEGLSVPAIDAGQEQRQRSVEQTPRR